MEAWKSSPVETKIAVVKKKDVPILKGEKIVWMIKDQCKYKLGRVIQVLKGDDGVDRSPRVKMEHGEFNRLVVKLAPVFYVYVSEIDSRVGEVGATPNQQQRQPDSKK